MAIPPLLVVSTSFYNTGESNNENNQTVEKKTTKSVGKQKVGRALPVVCFKTNLVD